MNKVDYYEIYVNIDTLETQALFTIYTHDNA